MSSYDEAFPHPLSEEGTAWRKRCAEAGEPDPYGDGQPRSGFVLHLLQQQEDDNGGDPLQPGTEGWWPVVGARVRDIRADDLVIVKGSERDSPSYQHRIRKVIPPDGGLADQCAPRFENDLGSVHRFGMLMQCWIYRRGTHRTLAGSVR